MSALSFLSLDSTSTTPACSRCHGNYLRAAINGCASVKGTILLPHPGSRKLLSSSPLSLTFKPIQMHVVGRVVAKYDLSNIDVPIRNLTVENKRRVKNTGALQKAKKSLRKMTKPKERLQPIEEELTVAGEISAHTYKDQYILPDLNNWSDPEEIVFENAQYMPHESKVIGSYRTEIEACEDGKI